LDLSCWNLRQGTVLTDKIMVSIHTTPANYAGTIAASGSNAAQDERFAFAPVAIGGIKTAEALIAVE
jgi:hypothetical protein